MSSQKTTPGERIYMIDGVKVSRKIYDRRKSFGEYAGARFQIVDLAPGPKVKR